MNRQSALETIRAAAPDLRREFGVVNASLFGSVGRDESDELSDLDVAVRFADPAPDAWMLCRVSGFLMDLFNRDVDVVALPARDAGLARAIEKDAAFAF